ncbi:MAG: hypothetical protein ACLUGQ_10225 [Coprococcus sp.]
MQKAVNLNKETSYCEESVAVASLHLAGWRSSECAEYLSKAAIPEEDRKIVPLDYYQACKIPGDPVIMSRQMRRKLFEDRRFRDGRPVHAVDIMADEEGYHELGIL